MLLTYTSMHLAKFGIILVKSHITGFGPPLTIEVYSFKFIFKNLIYVLIQSNSRVDVDAFRLQELVQE
jgi:hypothetical protein